MVITLNVDPTEDEIREIAEGIANGTYRMNHEGNIKALPTMIERVRKAHPGTIDRGNADILYDPSSQRVIAAIKGKPI